MARIEKLTDAQIALFPEFVKRWTDIGLCTDAADRPRAEAGVRKAYEIAGLAPPKIVWCGSPLSQGLTRALIFGLADSEAKIGEAIKASVRDSVGDSVRASVRDSVWASVGDSVWASVWDSVRDSVWDSVRDSVRASGYGQHDAGWLAFYEYFRDACALSEQTQRLCGIWEIAQSAGWWLPHKNLCWISERHATLHRNDAGRLHCEEGPALAYPDGWQIWAIGGVRIDEQIVMQPKSQTVDQIRGEKNEEVKRIRIDRFGWDHYLTGINATRIDRRRNDIEGTREALYRADGHSVLVCACPSTAKVFSLEVPPATETCEQAQRYLSSGLSSRIISAS
jgi:hypothetical protein